MTAVKKIMTQKLATIGMGKTLGDARQLMVEKCVRHLPVVDAMDDIVGMLSFRDLDAYDKFANVPVEIIMRAPVVYVDQNTPLKQAMIKMLELKISSLLVADSNEDCVGIVTTDDFLWRFVDLLEDKHKDDISLLSATTRLTIGEIAKQLANMGI